MNIRDVLEKPNATLSSLEAALPTSAPRLLPRVKGITARLPMIELPKALTQLPGGGAPRGKLTEVFKSITTGSGASGGAAASKLPPSTSALIPMYFE